MGFKDHFSVAKGYAAHRPTYPDALFAWLAEVAPAHDLAWDCATGSGQAARGLEPHFSKVVASDASLTQMTRATGGLRFHRLGGQAESAPLRSASVDLITVGQALHWFDFEAFYREVRRVAKPGGVVAAWTYPFFSSGADVDPLLDHFANQTVGPYWPPERRYVDNRYRDIPFPFERVATPEFSMAAQWDLADLEGYLGTWSAVNRYRNAVGKDPVAPLMEELKPRWVGLRTVVWELPMLAGKVA